MLSKRLGRALRDVEWRVVFPNAFVEILNRINSDHYLLLIHFKISSLVSSIRLFCFFVVWAGHPEYHNLVVEKDWKNGEENIKGKLSRVRNGSVTFNKDVQNSFLPHTVPNFIPKIKIDALAVLNRGALP